MALLKVLRRLLRGVLLTLAAAVLFIEEWGWRPLSAGLAWFARWPPLARLEAAIRRVPPMGALVLFVAPTVLLFPVKIAALWLMHQGRPGLGLVLIVAAKLVGTALLGRLYVLTQAQLMQFPWFARALHWWVATKQRVRAALHHSLAWRMARVARRCARSVLRRFAR